MKTPLKPPVTYGSPTPTRPPDLDFEEVEAIAKGAGFALVEHDDFYELKTSDKGRTFSTLASVVRFIREGHQL